MQNKNIWCVRNIIKVNIQPTKIVIILKVHSFEHTMNGICKLIFMYVYAVYIFNVLSYKLLKCPPYMES